MAGDSVIFKDGVYNVGVGQHAWPSGVPGKPITFRAENRHQAIWKQGGNGDSVALSAVSYINFEDLVISGDIGMFSHVYLCRLDASDHIVFDHCKLINTDGHPLAILHGSTDITVTGCLISPEHTTLGERDGIWIGGLGGASGNSNITIDNCEVQHIGHVGIAITEGSDIAISDCHIHDVSSHGIELDNYNRGTSISDITISNCTINDSGLWIAPADAANNGIRITDEAANIRVHHNVLFNHGLAGVFVETNAKGPVSVYHNTFYNCNLGNLDWIGDGYGYIHIYYNEAQTPEIAVKNNIFYVTNTDRCRVYHVTDRAMTAHFDADYNLLYADVSEDQRIRINGVNYTSFAAYKSAGYEPHTIINDAPGFQDADSGDFVVGAESPAVDTGIDLGYPFSGAAPDIGAFEYQVGFTLTAAPINRVINPGGIATYKLTVQPDGDFTATVNLVAASPSPRLTLSLHPTIVAPPDQAAPSITDTHTGTLPSGLWYIVPITDTGGGVTQKSSVDLLVGSTSVYLPVILQAYA